MNKEWVWIYAGWTPVTKRVLYKAEVNNPPLPSFPRTTNLFTIVSTKVVKKRKNEL